MLLRFAVFGLMALGLGGFGLVAWLATRSPPTTHSAMQEGAPPAAQRTILVAASALSGGTLLKPENFVARELPAPPVGALDDSPTIRSELTGAMLRHSLVTGEPVLQADVMRPGDHGFLAAVLGVGMRAASVGVDSVSGSAGLIWPGDKVDLILTQSLDDPSLPMGRRVAAETVLSNVRVIAIDQMLARGVEPGGTAAGANASRTVTLEVTSSQAERVAVATRLGRLSLAVRSAETSTTKFGDEAAEQPAVQTTWGGDVSPALGRPAPSSSDAPTVTVHLFQGQADVKEFKF